MNQQCTPCMYVYAHFNSLWNDFTILNYAMACVGVCVCVFVSICVRLSISMMIKSYHQPFPLISMYFFDVTTIYYRMKVTLKINAVKYQHKRFIVKQWYRLEGNIVQSSKYGISPKWRPRQKIMWIIKMNRNSKWIRYSTASKPSYSYSNTY